MWHSRKRSVGPGCRFGAKPLVFFSSYPCPESQREPQLPVVKLEVECGKAAAKKIVIYPSVHSEGSYISNQSMAGASTPQEFIPSCYRIQLLLFLQHRWCESYHLPSECFVERDSSSWAHGAMLSNLIVTKSGSWCLSNTGCQQIMCSLISAHS